MLLSNENLFSRDVVEVLREKRPDARIVVLTGYGAIATAVAAVKIGATDYLSKPADANDVTAALLAEALGPDFALRADEPVRARTQRGWEERWTVFEWTAAQSPRA